MWVWLDFKFRFDSDKRGFSILGGSSVGVAWSCRFRCRPPGGFQYPRRIECGCGEVCIGVDFFEDLFQYPRRIECGCGPGLDAAHRVLDEFQYPRRIECGCGDGYD